MEDGLPAVVLDWHSHIAGPDFLQLPIAPLKKQLASELPPEVQAMREVLQLRPVRQKKLKIFEDWARIGENTFDDHSVKLMLDGWVDVTLRCGSRALRASQITCLVNKYPALGLVVDGDSLIFEEF